MILVEKKKNKNKITITFEGRVSCIYNVKRGNFSRVFSHENYFAFFSFIG